MLMVNIYDKSIIKNIMKYMWIEVVGCIVCFKIFIVLFLFSVFIIIDV